MSLKDTLSGIVEAVDGAISVVIMAFDGIPIDEVNIQQSDFDAQTLAVEYASLIKDICRTVGLLKVGNLEEVSITTGKITVIVRMLNDELFIVLIMGKDGNIGMGRYLLRLKSAELARELA